MKESTNRRKEYIIVGVITLISALAFYLASGISPLLEARKNSQAPVLTTQAEIIEKNSPTKRTHYVTFRLDENPALSIEMLMHFDEYARLEPGGKGKLTYQGKRFISFSYSTPVFTAWGDVIKRQYNSDEATFKLNSGQIIELKIPPNYPIVSDGEYGEIIYQDGRLISFNNAKLYDYDIQRQSDSVVAPAGSDPYKKRGNELAFYMLPSILLLLYWIFREFKTGRQKD